MRLHRQNFKIERNLFMFFLDIWFASTNQFLLLPLASTTCHLWKCRINTNLLCRSPVPLELICGPKYSNWHSQELQLPDTKCEPEGEGMWPYFFFGSGVKWAYILCPVWKVAFHVAESANGCDYGTAHRHRKMRWWKMRPWIANPEYSKWLMWAR